ncbi:MAG: hypothetical protein HZC25_08420 [Rhodospirillales bacterium]|nr:hypothetical protein [Rhodospirillales bacterium]
MDKALKFLVAGAAMTLVAACSTTTLRHISDGCEKQFSDFPSSFSCIKEKVMASDAYNGNDGDLIRYYLAFGDDLSRKVINNEMLGSKARLTMLELGIKMREISESRANASAARAQILGQNLMMYGQQLMLQNTTPLPAPQMQMRTNCIRTASGANCTTY